MHASDVTAKEFTDWLYGHALPLWATAGIDAKTRTSWEALSHDGQPCEDLPRRLRVQARQAFCFGRAKGNAYSELALDLFHNTVALGFQHASGNLVATLAPDLEALDAPHDLYDLAFLMLAASALIDAGHDVSKELNTIEVALDRLKAPVGWYENAAHTLPRRQNPHMHLFEASTELYRVTQADRFIAIAKQCLDLFKHSFLQKDGSVLEFFGPDWSPLNTSQQDSEPGHMAEWIYLLDQYEAVTGEDAEVDLEQIFLGVLEARDERGFLWDSTVRRPASRRLWPQTEYLKASVVMSRRGYRGGSSVSPSRIAGLIFQDYLTNIVQGGWYDKRDENGALCSHNMPASTLYHIMTAHEVYTRHSTA